MRKLLLPRGAVNAVYLPYLQSPRRYPNASRFSCYQLINHIPVLCRIGGLDFAILLHGRFAARLRKRAHALFPFVERRNHAARGRNRAAAGAATY